jgi:hypothetical protein
MVYNRRGPFVNSGPPAFNADTGNHFDDALEWQDQRVTVLETFQSEAGATFVLVDDHDKQTHDDLDIDAETLQTLAASAFVQQSEKPMAGVVATVDANTGKIHASLMPESVTGGLSYQGAWNANTNTPTIPAPAEGNDGWFYKVSVAGTRSLHGQPSETYAINDTVISDGATWVRIPSGEAVGTVFGRTGAIVAQAGDYSADQITATPQGTLAGTTVAAQITELLNESNVTDEQIQDVAAALLTAGVHSNIAAAYDDVNNRINLTASTGESTGMTTVDTVSVLESLNTTAAPDGSVRQVLGYYSAGDGGGDFRVRRVNSSGATRNGVTIFNANGGGKWLRLGDLTYLNVKQAGAKGDMSQNDAPFFAAAINALPSQGGLIDVPTGAYRFDTSVVTDNVVFHLRGRGIHTFLEAPGTINSRQGVKLVANVNNLEMFRIKYGFWTGGARHAGPTFEDISFVDGSPLRNAIGVEVYRCNWGNFVRCRFYEMLRGVALISLIQAPSGNNYGRRWTSGETITRGDIRGASTLNNFIYRANFSGKKFRTSGTEPTWPTTAGGTVNEVGPDGTITWEAIPYHTAGTSDASWWNFDACHALRCNEAVYVPHTGGFHWIGGSCYNLNFESPAGVDPHKDPTFFKIHGGSQHRIAFVKCDNKGNVTTADLGAFIEFEGQGCEIVGNIIEDIRTGVRVRQNQGTASGGQVTVTSNHFYGELSGNRAIDIGSGVFDYQLIGNSYRGSGFSGGNAVNRIVDSAGTGLILDYQHGMRLYGESGAGIISGTGTPEGVVSAGVGTLFLRRDGGAGTTLYVKQSGTGNTGWVAK